MKQRICRRKPSGRPSVSTEEVIDDYQTHTEPSPSNAISKLLTQIGTTKMNDWNLALKMND